jgi:hypothetical protein
MAGTGGPVKGLLIMDNGLAQFSVLSSQFSVLSSQFSDVDAAIAAIINNKGAPAAHPQLLTTHC